MGVPNAMLPAYIQELFTGMNSSSAAGSAAEFHAFTVSICDQIHGSQIPILHVQLRHILFEETLQEFATHLHEALLQPLSIGELPLFEARERMIYFFAEGGEITMDENLNYYEANEIVGIMSQFDAALSFALYYPQSGATRNHTLRSVDDIHDLYEHFRLAGLLQ